MVLANVQLLQVLAVFDGLKSADLVEKTGKLLEARTIYIKYALLYNP